MLQSLALVSALVAVSPVANETAAPVSVTASIADPIAEMLGKAVLVFCRPSSVEHGITMLSSDWSTNDEFRALRVRFRWYGFWTETPYTSQIRIEIFTGGKKPKVTSIEYDDDCVTPCEMCKKLGSARAILNDLL